MKTQIYAKEDKPSLMFMYHEDDEPSMQALEEFKKTESKLRGFAHFVTIGCHQEGFPDMMPACKQEINSGVYPLISVMAPPYRRKNPYTKQLEDNKEVPYGNRPRTSKSMSKFLQSNIPNFSELISKGSDYDDKVLNSKAINKVVLFSEKLDKSKQPPVLYKALTNHFKDRLEFYNIDTQKLKKRVKSMNITDFPTILVHANYDSESQELDQGENNLENLMKAASESEFEVIESENIVKYTGSIDILELIKFLEVLALNSKYDADVSSKPNEERRSKYTIVNHSNYTKGFINDYRTQVVFFDESFDGIKEKFDHVAEELHGPANIVFFDCKTKQSKDIAKENFNIKKFPNILVFSTGVEKDVDNSLEISPSIDADDLVSLIMETEMKDNLKDVSDSMISSVILTNALQLRKMTLVYLYEDNSRSDEIPLAFKALSMHPRFVDNVDFVAIKNPGEMTRQQFQVRKLPIIIGGLPPPEGMDASNPEGGGNIQTMVYQGDVNDFYELLSYNLGAINMFYPQSEEEQKAKEKTSVETIPFQEVTATNFDEICESRKGLCVLAYLPATLYNEYDISEHNERIQILEKRNKESSSQFKYMWINASCHDYSLLHFDLSPLVLPTLVIYSPSQQKYSKMITSFSEENIIDFEKSFEGTGKTRISVYSTNVPFKDIIRDIDCPNLMLDSDMTDDLIMSEEDEEIMREIMEEEKRKKEQQREEEDKPTKKKKKSKKKKN